MHLSNGGLGAGRGGVEDAEQQRRAILAVVIQQLRHRQPRDVCHLQPTWKWDVKMGCENLLYVKCVELKSPFLGDLVMIAPPAALCRALLAQ